MLIGAAAQFRLDGLRQECLARDEFAAALVENGSIFEINISAILLNPHYPERFVGQYLEYVAALKARGDWCFCEGINHLVLHVFSAIKHPLIFRALNNY